MANVDDHGLEVLKKAARNINPTPKKDYALQVILVKDESGVPLNPTILNVPCPDADTEILVDLPEGCRAFVLKARRVSRLKMSFEQGETSSNYLTIPRGGYWVQDQPLNGKDVYIQSNVADNLIEVVAYT